MSNAGDKPVVTQRARNAAADIMDFEGVFETLEWDGVVYAKAAVLRGDGDDHPTVQAFARFEQETLSREGREALMGLEWTEDGYSLRTPYDGDVDGDGRHIMVGGEIAVTFADSEEGEKAREAFIAALSPPASEERDVGREAGNHPDLEGHIADAVRDACNWTLGKVVSFDESRGIAATIMDRIKIANAEYAAALSTPPASPEQADQADVLREAGGKERSNEAREALDELEAHEAALKAQEG